MKQALRELVWQRAQARCEYYQIPQQFVELTHEVDHVIGQQHRGLTEADNLCLACFSCNKSKGPNISSRDPDTNQTVDLYNPRQDEWSDHFRWHGAVLDGVTPVGRATVALLSINALDRATLRESLIAEGVFPPSEAG